MPVVRCNRCDRRYRKQDDWNVIADKGVIVGYLCPGCQTPDEQAEADVHAATLNYFTDSQGRFIGRIKTAIPELSDGEMQALTESTRSDLKFAVLTATDNDADEVGKLMFVVGDNGPVGYVSLGNRQPDPMTVAALVEQFSEQYGR